MRFELTEEHEAFRKVVREFAESEIAPHAAAWDQTGEFPADTVRAIWVSLRCLTPKRLAAWAATSPRCVSPSRRSAG